MPRTEDFDPVKIDAYCSLASAIISSAVKEKDLLFFSSAWGNLLIEFVGGWTKLRDLDKVRGSL